MFYSFVYSPTEQKTFLLSHSLRTLPPYQPETHLGAYEVQDTFTPNRYYPLYRVVVVVVSTKLYVYVKYIGEKEEKKGDNRNIKKNK